jgi:hypothetical protein
MPLQTINAYRLSPSGAWELTGLHERRTFYGYTLREAKRVYRDEFRKLNGGDEFKNAKGQLTAYAFSCGYVERLNENVWLWRDGVYHVQTTSGFWESFATLNEARQAARRVSKGAK